MVKGLVSVHQQLHYVLASTARSYLMKQHVVLHIRRLKEGDYAKKNPPSKTAKDSCHHTPPNIRQSFFRSSLQKAEFLQFLTMV